MASVADGMASVADGMVSVADGMEDGVQPAGVVDRLPVPYDILFVASPVVLAAAAVLPGNVIFVDWRGRKDENEGDGRTGYEAQDFRVIQREDILEGPLAREAELMGELREELGVRF